MAEEKKPTKKKRPGSENLKPVRTKEEARERGRAGGIKSGQVRKARKTLKEELLALLETKVDGKTLQEKMSFAIITEAMTGNTKAFTAIRDTIGEKPKDEVDVNVKKLEDILNDNNS